jgi:2-polyprenyl-3-methyl-5-hydroxy-6-metoxy-1,4-benzoquinol methylase
MPSAADQSSPLAQLLDLYSTHPFFSRLFMRARWAICPFERLLDEIPAAKRILELGCGNGILANLVNVTGRAEFILALDQDPKAIRRAIQTIHGRTGIEFRQHDANSFKSSGTFDVVIINDVIHHVPRERQSDLLKSAWSALRENGHLLIKDVDDRPWWARFLAWLHDWARLNPPTLLKRDELADMIRRADFQIMNQWNCVTVHIPHVTFLCRKQNTGR